MGNIFTARYLLAEQLNFLKTRKYTDIISYKLAKKVSRAAGESYPSPMFQLDTDKFLLTDDSLDNLGLSDWRGKYGIKESKVEDLSQYQGIFSKHIVEKQKKEILLKHWVFFLHVIKNREKEECH
jgi:hypothetical protein